MAIIAIAGRIGSGKDTVASMIQYLVSNQVHNLNLTYTDWLEWAKDPDGLSSWQIKKFAGKLKEIASMMTGIPVEKFEDQEFKKKTFKQLAEEGYISKELLNLLCHTEK